MRGIIKVYKSQKKTDTQLNLSSAMFYLHYSSQMQKKVNFVNMKKVTF